MAEAHPDSDNPLRRYSDKNRYPIGSPERPGGHSPGGAGDRAEDLRLGETGGPPGKRPERSPGRDIPNANTGTQNQRTACSCCNRSRSPNTSGSAAGRESLGSGPRDAGSGSGAICSRSGRAGKDLLKAIDRRHFWIRGIYARCPAMPEGKSKITPESSRGRSGALGERVKATWSAGVPVVT